jgi:hypothetical protein
VRYREYEGEFWLEGRGSLGIRLFYCPICGSKLRLKKEDRRFYKQSPRETAKLRRRFQELTSVDKVLRLFGPPDRQYGPSEDYLYPEGKRTRLAHRRVLFYKNLARTVDLVVYELPDERVDLRLVPKLKRSNT